MDAIFGSDMPLAVKFLIAFLVVLGLIGLVSWAVRRFGMDRLSGAANRGRASRLAVIDAASVDSRRKLVIIRRDNVEHLLMIGGPTDVVVETNIVRAVGAQRDAVTGSRTSAVDTLPRAVPLPDAPRGQIDFARTTRDDLPQWTAPEPAPVLAPPPARPSARSVETLAGLAAELTARPTTADYDSAPSRSTPTLETSRNSTPTPPLAPESPPGPGGDQNLAEMAQRLEAALRRPGANGARPPENKPKAEATAAPGVTTAAAARNELPRMAEMKPAAPAPGKPKTMYDSLEQEMASLLGRPKKS